ncbi:glutathione S-transferase A-like [Haliotis rubra]|uniref:glutathione S-transferase A-like n=1 Tax=Haliotis rubra TaxID=36100 RepID=UPI001EE5CC43|nr:glutathione S-transferase A-like [Haliotis rubra]
MPTFKDGDVVVNESNAICFYLKNKFPDKGTKLLPDDKAEFGRIVKRCAETATVYDNFIVNIAHYRFSTPKEKLDEELLKTKYEAARKELKLWEGYLAASGGYVVGSNFTMADVFFFPYVAFGVRLGLDVSKYPAISAYYDKVKDRPSVKASWPPHWAEKPADTSMFRPI